MIDFSKSQLINITDEEYFSIGKIDLFDHNQLVVSASFLKQVFDRDLYEVLIKGSGTISDELQYMFDVGSAFHTFVLESREFDSRYYVSDYKSLQEDRKFISSIDYDFIVGCYNNIKIKYPYILDESDQNELVITTNFDGVPFRCKIDKLVQIGNTIKVIDLKSVWFDFYGKEYKRNKDGIRWGLIKYIQSLNYDIQGYAYIKAVKRYFEDIGISVDVEFLLLLASKDTYDVKMVKFSPEMIQSGKDKFKIVFPEIQQFFNGGIEYVEQEEII